MKKRIVILLAMFFCIYLPFVDIYGSEEDIVKSGIEVIMLDIGQGDSFLIRVNEKVILLDTGEKKYYEFLDTQLKHFGVDKIDLFIISHMDTDHMGAATLVIQDYDIKSVLIPKTPGESNEYNKLINLFDREKIDITYAYNDDCFSLGPGCDCNILSVDKGDDTNESSIVMKLVYYDNSFLFTGDASASTLNKIMEEGKDISVDVLKIPHHGSDSSSPLLFLRNTGAQYALISVGRKNAYGHPKENVLRRLETLGIEVFRTDVDGTVVIKGNGVDLDHEKVKIVDWDAEERLKVVDGPIIANVNSGVYHNSDCLSLPAERNRIYFLCYEDAETSGYRPCSMCIKAEDDEVRYFSSQGFWVKMADKIKALLTKNKF